MSADDFVGGRMIRLSEPCPQCGGTGEQRWCSLCKEPHKSVPPFIGCAVGDRACPACHSGMVPDVGMKEAAIAAGVNAARALSKYPDLIPSEAELAAVHHAVPAALVAAARYQSEKGGE